MSKWFLQFSSITCALQRHPGPGSHQPCCFKAAVQGVGCGDMSLTHSCIAPHSWGSSLPHLEGPASSHQGQEEADCFHLGCGSWNNSLCHSAPPQGLLLARLGTGGLSALGLGQNTGLSGEVKGWREAQGFGYRSHLWGQRMNQRLS